jgi:hypothetical protein
MSTPCESAIGFCVFLITNPVRPQRQTMETCHPSRCNSNPLSCQTAETDRVETVITQRTATLASKLIKENPLHYLYHS